MMNKLMLFVSIILVLGRCTPSEKTSVPHLVNPAHLDHLFEEITVGDERLGTIWIYCEAPDYHHVGDEDEGFTCVDDVARALVFYCRGYQSNPSEMGLKKIRSLTAFLLHMRSDNGFFYNFMLPGGQINTTHQNSVARSSFWTWRAFWALSELQLLDNGSLADLKKEAKPALDELVGKLPALCPSPADTAQFGGIALPKCLAELGADQASVILLGLSNLYQAAPSDSLKNLLLSFGNLLLRGQFGDAQTAPYHAFLSWQNYWHAWGNTQAYSLLRAGNAIHHQPFIEAGLNEVRHFYPYLLKKGILHEFKLVQESEKLAVHDEKPFPQIAYDLSPMILAAAEAYRITGDKAFWETATQLASWFSGNNPAKQAMYDPATGRCFDGIGSATEVNRNAGAESTIEALLALQAVDFSHREN
jgi:hypothetical protein